MTHCFHVNTFFLLRLVITAHNYTPDYWNDNYFLDVLINIRQHHTRNGLTQSVKKANDSSFARVGHYEIKKLDSDYFDNE